MKAIAIFLILLGVASSTFAVDRDKWISPDKHFLARTISRNPDETGCRLFLSAVGHPGLGVLLRENDRWIDATWSPDSKFLAVTDGSDGHVTDIFIYRVVRSDDKESRAVVTSFPSFGGIAASAESPGLRAELWYHTPNISTYDTQWKFAGWSHDNTSVRLTRRTLREHDKTFTVELKPPTKPKNQEGEQAGTGQPATRSELKSDGNQNPNPESEGRSR
jgi:hypothetical protein